MPKCEVCSVQLEAAACQQLSPRQLAGMRVLTDSSGATSLKAVSESIIVFDNPKGAADNPIFWICSACLQKHFAPGDYERNIQEAQDLKDVISGEHLHSTTQDFVSVHPKAVLVLSPLNKDVVEEDKTWLGRFLAVALGSYLNHQEIRQTTTLLSEYLEAGVLFVCHAGVTTDYFCDEDFCSKQVARAFPEVITQKPRLRIVVAEDPFHANVPTCIIWVFPANTLEQLSKSEERP